MKTKTEVLDFGFLFVEKSKRKEKNRRNFIHICGTEVFFFEMKIDKNPTKNISSKNLKKKDKAKPKVFYA